MQALTMADSSDQSIQTGRTNPAVFSVGMICIQANIGKPNDHPPPSRIAIPPHFS
jgi:hypothetical protein